MGHESRIPLVATSTEQRRYLRPSPPGPGLLALLGLAPRLERRSQSVPLFPPFLLQQILRRFLHLRRRNTSATANEGMAEQDSRLSELQAEPDVSSVSSEHAANSVRAMADMAMSEDMAITSSDTGMAQGISKTETMPTSTMILAPKLDFYKQKGVPSQQQVSRLRTGQEALQDCMAPQTTGPPYPLRPAHYEGEGNHFLGEAGEVAPLDSIPYLPYASSRCQPW
ncbi:hypothetical protein EK904_004179 [Melospiza melodia maxima]|nr:hypothetical protein EK904_004179 [Melospiza melodia maxima]